MFSSDSKHIDARLIKTSVRHASLMLSFREVLRLWRGDREFGIFFTKLLSESPFEAFFWETPPVNAERLDRSFEFVLIDAPELARVRADPSAFRERFVSRGTDEVVVFQNLGKDATLVVPAPIARPEVYPHLGSFIRNGPASQQAEFWRRVGETMTQSISSAPVWLSTAGLGVSWLHLRIDSHPKYYRYEPYKSF
jgi:hypothetical protein